MAPSLTAPTARPVAFRWDDATHTTGAARKTDDSGHYTVTRFTAAGADHYKCNCVGNATWGKACKHIKAAMSCHAAPPPPARYCEHCRIDVARQCSPFCPTKCQQAAATEALMSLPVDMADAVTQGELVEETEDFTYCGCVRCGLTYAFDEAHPLLCPACRLADVPAVCGIALVDVLPSSPEEIEATRELMRETVWTLISGVAPQFAGIA